MLLPNCGHLGLLFRFFNLGLLSVTTLSANQITYKRLNFPYWKYEEDYYCSFFLGVFTLEKEQNTGNNFNQGGEKYVHWKLDIDDKIWRQK